MYATAHRVVSPEGEEGINAFLHMHGVHFPWPEDPSQLSESEPGEVTSQNVAISPGRNRVRSYLDVLAPDASSPEELVAALDGLFLELSASDAGTHPEDRRLPDPLIYQHGRVVLRFGVEPSLGAERAAEFSELRHYVDPHTATWTGAANAI